MVGQILQDMFRPGLLIRKMCLKKIRKEEYFQHGENNEKLDELADKADKAEKKDSGSAKASSKDKEAAA